METIKPTNNKASTAPMTIMKYISGPVSCIEYDVGHEYRKTSGTFEQFFQISNLAYMIDVVLNETA